MIGLLTKFMASGVFVKRLKTARFLVRLCVLNFLGKCTLDYPEKLKPPPKHVLWEIEKCLTFNHLLELEVSYFAAHLKPSVILRRKKNIYMY